jgi:hypothetical protein
MRAANKRGAGMREVGARGASTRAVGAQGGSTRTRLPHATLGIFLAWAVTAAPQLAGDRADAAPVVARDVLAGKPSALSVTVYRAPDRGGGAIDLDDLGGFALVSETRTVHLPAGVSRLRFAGVADGIEPASAIVTGFAQGIIEKNRAGKLLSPATLAEAAVGKSVTLLRTDKKTGKSTRVPGTLVSTAEGGVVFQTAEGVEALRCSGLPETFLFDSVDGLAASPTLSVLVRSPEAVTETVTLSYLSRGFDWAADYVATQSDDGMTLDLGAWVTLANGNGVGFPAAQTQVVAGRVNRESGEVEPIDAGGPLIAQCWPRGSTSDSPEYLQFKKSTRGMAMDAMAITHQAAPPPALEEIVVTEARKVQQEQLGDLKLYRVPDRTTVASRQSKQVRLMDRLGIPVTPVYGADLPADESADSSPAHLLLRTTNDAAHHLGLPLPSGHIAVFALRGGDRLLLHESDMRDLAVGEEVEVDMGESADVRVAVVKEQIVIDPAKAVMVPLVPGVKLRSTQIDAVTRVDISNARAASIQFELRLHLTPGGRVVRADHTLGAKNGRPIFRVNIPANQTVTLRYQTQSQQTEPRIG